MKIQWHGETKFTLTGKQAKIAINHDGDANIYLFSKLNEEKKETEDKKVFDWPGEYEVKGVAISCLPCESKEEENLVYYLEIDGIKVCHLGLLKGKMTPEMTQEISETDVLLIPIGGENSLSAKAAHEIIEEIEPRIVVPTNYTDEELQAFIKEMSIPNVEPTEKFEIKSRGMLPEDRTDYIILAKV